MKSTRRFLRPLVLVIFVVFLSLQSWRATLIPLIAVPISLIGTFGFMLMFGFSLNMLTLLGLVLAIGIVVDDAIVVVENVERVMHDENLPPREATKRAMADLTSPIIASSLVLAAMFVPVSFLGHYWPMYRQFTVTIVVSVLLSTVVALTLSPAMCAIILRPAGDGPKNRLFSAYKSLAFFGKQPLCGSYRAGCEQAQAYAFGIRGHACGDFLHQQVYALVVSSCRGPGIFTR